MNSMKKMMMAAGCLALAWTAGAAVEVSDLSVSPRTDGSGLADISLKVTSDVGGTNLVFEVAAYSKDRDAFFVDGDISLDNGDTYTQDVLTWYGTAGKTQDVHLAWNWQKHNPDVDWSDVTVEVTAKLQGENVAVKCQNGTFVGVRDSMSGVVAFKSVPYAKPPTKETGLRWKPPVRPDDSDEVFSARHFGPAAAQTYVEGEAASFGPVSEDCLKLSIWTADGFRTDNPSRAVMFFIHGGSYGWGGMCDPLYDGERLVRDNPDVILVSCDYRLNAFGFLDLTGLPGYDPEKHKDYDQSVNLGILDQQAGLRWVKENIAAFGGDPNNITIFGESAGGGSVSCLLQAKGSEGLFRRAIVMSGALDLTDSPENYKAGNQAYLLMKAAGKSSIDELLACSTKELLAALDTPLSDSRIATIRHRTPREGGSQVTDLNNYPMCDDVRGIVASDPYEACRTNEVAKDVDVMIGTTSEELNYWATMMYGVSSEALPSTTDPLGYFYQYLSNKVNNIRALYARVGNETAITKFLEGPGASHPFDSDERYNLGGLYPNIWGRTELMSELSFRMPAIMMAERHGELVRTSGGCGKTYMYYFCRPQKSLEMPWCGACHASELTSVFKTLNLEVDGGEDAKKTLAKNVSGAFVAFAKTGDPGDEWATYDTEERRTTVIGKKGDFNDAKLRLQYDPDGDQRKLLEPDYLRYREARLRTGDSSASWHGLRHIAPYLHEIWYDDYVFTADGSCLTTGIVSACSSVRKGNFHGRSLDYYLWDSPEFVVHVAAKPSVGRLSSVGVARQSAMRESGVLAGTYRESYETLPNWIQDGINEKHVVVNCNVVPRFDCGELPLENPDPNSTLPLHIVEIPRYLLDYATNAAHAVELLQGRTLFGSGGGNYLLHFMVSDPDETLVIEIILGKVVARRQEIMTNFNVNWDNALQKTVTDVDGWGRDHFWPIDRFERGKTDVGELTKLYTPCAMGIERYGELLANYDACGPSLDDMMALVKRVKYSQMYDKNMTNFWYSEWCEYDEKIRNEDFYSMNWSWNDGSKLDDWIQSGLEDAAYDLADFERARTNLTQRSETWITGHANVYDIEKCMFRMIVQEDYAHTYDFWLEPPPGSVENPWPVGAAGHETEVTAWTNGTGTLVVEGAGAVGRAPWWEYADGITKLQFAEGVTNLGETMATLPALVSVNGLTLDKFVEAGMLGVAKAGFSAIAVDKGVAQIGVMVSTNGDLAAATESWGKAKVEDVGLDKETGEAVLTIPAPADKGFFIVNPKPDVQSDTIYLPPAPRIRPRE